MISDATSLNSRPLSAKAPAFAPGLFVSASNPPLAVYEFKP
jgi:hypothetical protein